MTTSDATTPLGVLFGTDPARRQARLGSAIRKQARGGPLSANAEVVPARALGLVRRRLAALAADLLDHDLVDLAADGWRTHHRLVAAARETAERPGTEKVVPLATHDLSWTQHAEVDIVLDGATITTVALDLGVAARIEGLDAAVAGGALVGLASGSAEVTVTLAVDGAEVATGHGRLDLSGLWRRRTAIALLSEQERRSIDLRSTVPAQGGPPT
jgi:hypothetical protein